MDVCEAPKCIPARVYQLSKHSINQRAGSQLCSMPANNSQSLTLGEKNVVFVFCACVRRIGLAEGHILTDRLAKRQSNPFLGFHTQASRFLLYVLFQISSYLPIFSISNSNRGTYS